MIQSRLPRWPDRDRVANDNYWQIKLPNRPSLWARIWRWLHG